MPASAVRGRTSCPGSRLRRDACSLGFEVDSPVLRAGCGRRRAAGSVRLGATHGDPIEAVYIGARSMARGSLASCQRAQWPLQIAYTHSQPMSSGQLVARLIWINAFASGVLKGSIGV